MAGNGVNHVGQVWRWAENGRVMCIIYERDGVHVRTMCRQFIRCNDVKRSSARAMRHKICTRCYHAITKGQRHLDRG